MNKPILQVAFLLLLSIYCAFSTVFAQGISPYSLSTDWYFGRGGRLNFPSGNFPNAASPTPLYSAASYSKGKLETSTSLTFANGNVALFSNGRRVYDGLALDTSNFIRDLIVDNTCYTSSSGGAISFPDPTNPNNSFYLFTANDITGGSCTDAGLNRYRFTGSGANLSYAAGPNNLQTGGIMNEAITSGPDGTGGYWLVIHDRITANVYKIWHYTASGISGPVSFDMTDLANNATLQSYLKFSPCMNKMAFIGGGSLIVYDFNRETGNIGTQLRRIDGLATGYCGLEFSPDGNTIYYSRLGAVVNYLVISSGTTGTISGSKSWSMQLGLDGKIYTSPDNSTAIGVINNTNTPGSANYSTLSLPAGAEIISGLSNISWLNPVLPKLTASLSVNCSTYTHHIDFFNYFNAPVSIDSNTIEFNVNGSGWTSFSKPNFEYISTGGDIYSIEARFKDAYCGHLWQTPSIVVSPNCALPITLVSFEGYRINYQEVNLKWTASHDGSTNKFIIERSLDKVNFKEIGEVTANKAVSGKFDYSYFDKNAPTELVYYRVISVNSDGTKNIFGTIPVAPYESIKLSVNPNPFQNHLYVEVKNGKDAQLFVYDILGHILHSEIIDSNYYYKMIGDSFAFGTYIIAVNGSAEVVNKKVVKSDVYNKE